MYLRNFRRWDLTLTLLSVQRRCEFGSTSTLVTLMSSVLGNILTDICTVVELVIVLLLQGMMALRVYVLLERSKRVLAILMVGFLASQAVTFSTIISLLVRGGTIMPPAKVAISGIASCHKEPSEPQWVYPLSCSALLVFELLLIILCLYHAFARLNWPMATSIGHYAGSIVLLMYQQSLVYFIVALVSILLNAVSQAPTLRSSMVFSIVNAITDFIMLAMIGPRMMLGLRKQYEDDVNGYDLRTFHAATLRFADHNGAEDSKEA